jgi:hypothetical protein
MHRYKTLLHSGSLMALRYLDTSISSGEFIGWESACMAYFNTRIEVYCGCGSYWGALQGLELDLAYLLFII